MANELPSQSSLTLNQQNALLDILKTLNLSWPEKAIYLKGQRLSLIESIRQILELMTSDLILTQIEDSPTYLNLVLLSVQVDYLQKLESTMLSTQTQYLAMLSNLCQKPLGSLENLNTPT